MKCTLFVAVFCGTSFVFNSVLADPPKTPASSLPRDQPEWVAEIEAAIKAQKDRQQKLFAEFAEKWGKAKSETEQDALEKWRHEAVHELRKADRTAAHSLMSLLRKHADDPKVYMGLAFATMHGGSDDREEAGALMGKYHLSNPIVLKWAQFGRGDGCDDFREPIIRDLLADKEMAVKDRTLLQFSLAQYLKHKAEVARMSDRSITWQYGSDYIAKFRKRDVAKLEAEALEIFDQLIAKKVPDELHPGSSILESAKTEAYEMRHLAVGKKAPEIVGEDLDGKPMKLSDYRGKVVVLDFGVRRCSPCITFGRHLRKLIDQYAGRPFAGVGVNIDKDLKDAKAFVEENKFTWPTFWNGPTGCDGGIAKDWNVQGFPTVYVIDHAGVIRSKARGPEFDPLIEELVKKAEAAAGK
ncbi:thiol-disulfide isomerase-like thioredoxin : Thiol-disulfide isomerase-like thioredoxin OS=Singulisphaera acidiphila (strain ATCC BAA-1392 / DSM 18658 / VKM B-2454 / MOB10) GN=Sinac_1102 PE=4 SV=1: AhpC-TSA [Gemmata massiliana]|uniref:Thioredoxin domain-containing protein n=1 Tax=Gemmata massiliana TaxID=1210884 RepID=A0A6P2CQT6_9BACT|nr:TlpA disulfide reductase family protein [Gemmata massiliana]VTR91408.1 thiol-disulfide isomerase-like thioredoxin : Thiol-disulfide isomerase-like thioredoxin OS=Singulisphaera acidiphila (strain ATCC BAA-1392 / DSM 18658 / VKM B-2454 / MOB10) GN=Sinac_1102 PE=4 SV=1: AhpC-TSA [Gemmata massiliana]